MDTPPSAWRGTAQRAARHNTAPAENWPREGYLLNGREPAQGPDLRRRPLRRGIFFNENGLTLAGIIAGLLALALWCWLANGPPIRMEDLAGWL